MGPGLDRLAGISGKWDGFLRCLYIKKQSYRLPGQVCCFDSG
jgi:hypothetical protein